MSTPHKQAGQTLLSPLARDGATNSCDSDVYLLMPFQACRDKPAAAHIHVKIGTTHE